MLKKVVLGQTNFADLYQLFGFNNNEEFVKRKAKLFPCGNTDSEVATTSIFMASLSAVKEYREELFLTLGINKIKTRNVQIHVFTEISHKDNGDRPDGLIVITSGKHSPIIEWIGFVEAKVKDNLLCEKQISKYADDAKDMGIDSIITISNELATTPFDNPVQIKKRNFNLYHWSWTYLKVTASKLIRTDSIEDEDHIYILSELRRYFDAHKNLKNFINMGKDWKDCVGKVHTLAEGQKVDKETLDNIILAYKQEEKDISLQLTDRTNHVVTLLAKKDRVEEMEKMLNNGKVIRSQYFLDDARKFIFNVDIDFVRQNITCSTRIGITRGKAQAQTSTLIRMLEDESGYAEGIIINAVYQRNKTLNNNISLTQLALEKENAEPYSILDKKYGDEVKFFEIKTCDNLGLKRFQSTKNFIIELENITERFLKQVMENVN